MALLFNFIEVIFVNKLKEFNGNTFIEREDGKVISSSRLFTDGYYKIGERYWQGNVAFNSFSVPEANYIINIRYDYHTGMECRVYIVKFFVPTVNQLKHIDSACAKEICDAIKSENTKFYLKNGGKVQIFPDTPLDVQQTVFSYNSDISLFSTFRNFMQTVPYCKSVDAILSDLMTPQRRSKRLAGIGIVLNPGEEDSKKIENLCNYMIDVIEKRREDREQLLHTCPLKACSDFDKDRYKAS